MTKGNQVAIPYLDPNVQHVGISKLRALNVTQLRALDKTLVIQDNDKPLAVLLKYEHFIAMQEKMPDEE
jgi:translation initiation factor IF-3